MMRNDLEKLKNYFLKGLKSLRFPLLVITFAFLFVSILGVLLSYKIISFKVYGIVIGTALCALFLLAMIYGILAEGAKIAYLEKRED